MLLRKADHNDLDELIKIRLAYLNEDYHGLSDELTEAVSAQLPGYFMDHLGKDLYIYIAEEEQKIISGVFLLVVEKPANPHFITGKTGTVLNVYTQPEFRRQGLAGQLLKQAMEDAKQMDLSYLELSASKAGYPLYEKLGFVEVKSEYVPMKYTIYNIETNG
jgi:ribosomal protein S18 acetylase RimI-like enzyme